MLVLSRPSFFSLRKHLITPRPPPWAVPDAPLSTVHQPHQTNPIPSPHAHLIPLPVGVRNRRPDRSMTPEVNGTYWRSHARRSSTEACFEKPSWVVGRPRASHRCGVGRSTYLRRRGWSWRAHAGHTRGARSRRGAEAGGARASTECTSTRPDREGAARASTGPLCARSLPRARTRAPRRGSGRRRRRRRRGRRRGSRPSGGSRGPPAGGPTPSRGRPPLRCAATRGREASGRAPQS